MISFKTCFILLSFAVSLVVCQESGAPSTPQTPTPSEGSAAGCQNRTRRTEPDYYEEYDEYEDYYLDILDTDSVQKRSVDDEDDEYDEEVVFSRAGNRRRTPTSIKNAAAKETEEKDENDGTAAPPAGAESEQTMKKQTMKSSASGLNKRRKNKKSAETKLRESSAKRGGHRGHKHIKPIGQCLPQKSGWCLAINGTSTTEGVPMCDEKLDYCTDDCDCPGYQKCCYNSCGRTECLPAFTTVTTDGPSTEAAVSTPDIVTEPVMERKEPALSLI